MKGHHRRRPISEINVVPYIDVMLVLLIIFMITAPLLNQGITVDLPQATHQPINVESPQPVIVMLHKEGTLSVNIGEIEQKFAFDKLSQKIAEILKSHPKSQVLVGADKEIAYGRVIDLMSMLQDAGVDSLGMLTKPES